jgi:hypothetical protein
MWSVAVKLAIQLLAGLGIGKAMDTFVKPKVPAYYYPEPVYPGNKPLKIVWLIGSLIVGVLLTKWIGKKFKIQILK